MNYQAHRIGGICAAGVVATMMYNKTLDQPEAYIAIGLSVVGGAIGGLLPDIDHPTSKVGRRVPFISKPINAVFGHRGFTHSILAALLFTYLLFMLTSVLPGGFIGFYLPLVIGLSVGYVSHLLLDMLTVSGIPLFYPLSKKSFRLARLRSGRDDLMVSIIVTLGTVTYLYIYLGI